MIAIAAISAGRGRHRDHEHHAGVGDRAARVRIGHTEKRWGGTAPKTVLLQFLIESGTMAAGGPVCLGVAIWHCLCQGALRPVIGMPSEIKLWAGGAAGLLVFRQPWAVFLWGVSGAAGGRRCWIPIRGR